MGHPARFLASFPRSSISLSPFISLSSSIQVDGKKSGPFLTVSSLTHVFPRSFQVMNGDEEQGKGR